MTTTNTFETILSNLQAGLPLALAIREGLDEQAVARPGLISSTKLQEKILAVIERGQWKRADYLPNSKKIFQMMEGCSWEECCNVDAEAILLIAENIMKKVAKRAAERNLKLRQSMGNRAYYLFNYIMTATVGSDGGVCWRFSTELLPKGLLHVYLDHRGLSPVHGIPSMQIRNELVKVVEGAKMRAEVPRVCWAAWRESGMLPTKGNLAWWDDGSVIDLLLKCFPDAVNFQAYCQRVAAPLIPGGHHPNVKVIFAKGRVGPNGEVLFPWNEGWEDGVPDECDGAHYYNQDRVLTGEHKSIQFSIINGNGVFSKGIAEPVPGNIVGDFDVIIDPDQVKGSHKGKFKEGDTAICDLGIMRKYSGGQYPLNFEQIQFFNPVLHIEGVKGFRRDIESLIGQSASELFKGGTSGAIRQVAKVMPNIASIVKVVEAIDPEFNLLSLSVVQKALREHYRSSLWNLATGCGFYGRQMEVKIDGSLKRGECVCAISPGKEVAVWRMPCVLPQGLLTLTTVEAGARPLPPGRIYLSAFDTKAIQADDDGDIVGVTTNEIVIRLFRCRMTEEVFLIEPEGQKMKFAVKSEMGLKYLEIDPRGPVGLTTLWQAALLNQPDRSKTGRAFWWALAMAVINQYAIDMAKRVVKWPDPDHLARPESWRLNDNGFMELVEMKWMRGQVDGINPFPMEELKKWVEDKYVKLGIWVKVDGQLSDGEIIKFSIYPWRSQKDINGVHLNKRIDIGNFLNTNDISKRKMPGNAVQGVYNTAHKLVGQLIDLKKLSEEMNGKTDNEANVKLRDALLAKIKELGIEWKLLDETWNAYEKGTRQQIGLTEAGKEWSKLKNLPEATEGEEDDRKERMANIQEDLEAWLRIASIDQLLTAWHWELTPVWRNPNRRQDTTTIRQDDWWQINNPGHAMRAISFPGSPILEILGIEEEGVCPFSKKLISAKDGIVEKYLAKENPWDDLAHSIYTNRSHGDLVKKEEERVEFHQCEECQRVVTSLLLTAYRHREKKGVGTAAKVLTHRLNEATPEVQVFREEAE